MKPSSIVWTPFPPECQREEWDELTLESQDHNVFQSFAWGEYRRTFNWMPVRWIARTEDGALVAMVQLLTKQLPGGLKIAWSPGGPLLRFPHPAQQNVALTVELLLRQLKEQDGPSWVRFNSYLPHDPAVTYAFSRSCVRPLVPLTTGYSLSIDLRNSFATLTERFKPRHRAYVKQVVNKIECRAGRDSRFVEEFVKLHNEMTTRKGLSSHRTSRREIFALCEQLAGQAVVFTGYLDAEPLSSYIVVNSGPKAFYLMAATGQMGREMRASYGVFAELLQYLQKTGMTEFDLGGMDPNSPGARGVNQFKRGFGGELVQYVGEWEWAAAGWLRWAVNLGLWYRGKRL